MSLEGTCLFPKRQVFLPCSLKRIRDDRVTTQKFQSNSRTIRDSWRMVGNNIESSNRRNEFWTGKTIFKVIPNMQWGASMVDESDTEDQGSCGDSIVACTISENMDIIPLDDMFISHQYKLRHSTRRSHEWDIKMVLHRKNGKKLVYLFNRPPSDILVSEFKDYEVVLDIHDMKDETPCLLLMCAEEQSLITKIHQRDRFKLMHVVTVAEDDKLLSPFGRVKGAYDRQATMCSSRAPAREDLRGID